MSLGKISKVSRLCCSCGVTRQFHTNSKPLLFYATPNLSAEPMKRRKKVDLSKVIQSTQLKIRKMEREMRKREEKFGRTLKPVEEITGNIAIRRNRDKLRREFEPLPVEEIERRALLVKEWGHYKNQQHFTEEKALQKAINVQTKALNELRMESEELYQKAKQIHEGDIIYQFNGPTETPPADDFDSPDGQYIDTSRKW
ncbi:large ribosomal subunit protein mL40-like isoform X1 [Mytilus edulis]|uniref:Large ribosomal subunit protein mL40 n=2 Tax=Mytilus TaxID=6548 RepID=A0A8B6F179_MYTGA|nr:MRPL40 [Mytilus edulis]VDI42147.1 large subunit ribosomal protein L40 [Mytilus galloprovincialis]